LSSFVDHQFAILPCLGVESPAHGSDFYWTETLRQGVARLRPRTSWTKVTVVWPPPGGPGPTGAEPGERQGEVVEPLRAAWWRKTGTFGPSRVGFLVIDGNGRSRGISADGATRGQASALAASTVSGAGGTAQPLRAASPTAGTKGTAASGALE
jgi:hypothetical protein